MSTSYLTLLTTFAPARVEEAQIAYDLIIK